MKNLTIALVCVIFAAIVWARPEEEKYTSEYDDFNIDEILQNDRARRGYINCLKTGKKCTAEGQELRNIIPDAVKTGCSKCTDLQKERSKKVLDYTLANHPEEYKELEAVFDPTGEYKKKYAAELQKEGVALPD